MVNTNWNTFFLRTENPEAVIKSRLDFYLRALVCLAFAFLIFGANNAFAQTGGGGFNATGLCSFAGILKTMAAAAAVIAIILLAINSFFAKSSVIGDIITTVIIGCVIIVAAPVIISATGLTSSCATI